MLSAGLGRRWRSSETLRLLVLGGAWSFGLQLVSRAASFGVLLIGARTLSVRDLGLFFSLQAMMILSVVAWDFGTSALTTRDVAAGNSTERQILRRVLAIRLFLWPINMAVFLLGNHFLLGIRSGQDLHATAILWVTSWVTGFDILFNSMLIGSFKFKQASASTAVGRLLFPGLILLFAVLHIHIGLVIFALSLLISEIATVLLQVSMLVPLVASSPRDPQVRLTLGEVFGNMRRSAPLVLNELCVTVYNRLDIAIVAALAGAHAAGVYAPASRLQDALTLFPLTAVTALGPLAARRFAARGDAKAVRRPVLITIVLAMVVTLPATAIALLLTSPLVRIALGPQYEASIKPVRILILSLPFIAVGAAALSAVLGVGRTRATSAMYLTGLVVSLTGLTLLAPKWGAEGAAWASLAREPAVALVAILLLIRVGIFHERQIRLPNLRPYNLARAFGAPRYGWVAALILVGAGATGLILAEFVVSVRWLIVVASAIVSLYPFVVGAMLRRFDFFEPIYIFAISYLVLFVIRPVFDLTHDGGLPMLLGYSLEATYTEALAVGLIGACSIYAGYYLGLGTRIGRAAPVPSGEWYYGTLNITILCMIAVSAAIFLYFVSSIGGVGGLLLMIRGRSVGRDEILTSTSGYLYSAPYWLISVGILMVAISPKWTSPRAVLGFSLVLASQVMSVGNGDRSGFIPIACSLGLIAYLRQGSRPRIATITLVSVTVFFLGITLPREFRNVDDRRSSSETAFASVAHPGKAVREFFEGLDTAMVGGLAEEILIVPSRLDYQLGRTYLDDLSRPVPRALWPSKPRSGDEQLMQVLWPDFYRMHIRFYFSMFGEPYLNLGVVGVTFFGIVFGVLWKALYVWFAKDPRNTTVIALYALNWPFVFVYMRGGVGVDYQRQVIVVLPAVMALVIAQVRRRELGTERRGTNFRPQSSRTPIGLP
ncbi:MAG: hypothetical protein QOJ59_1035 [Thermomicrobiales bacterium]|nr:hypothetical protein [Thermomicrobiales bacterium]